MSLRAARARAAALKKIDEVLSSARGRSHAQVAADIMRMFNPSNGVFDYEIDTGYPFDKRELFWPVVAEWWSMCDFIPHKFGKLMRQLRSYWSPDCMSKEDRPLYDALPDRLTIYRGQCRGERPKSSWTLDLETAKWFGQRNSLF